MKVLALAFVLGLGVAAVPAASAHRGTGGKGYLSTVSGLEPNVVGIFVSVLSGDDRLRLSNYTHRQVTVLGYSGEPYLRFLPAGVFENVRSPNAYLDRFRYPPSGAPARFDPKAPPSWVRVADGVTYEWHDHRIHWKSTTPPPAVQRQPNRVHLIFNWRVPARTASKPFLIKGFLGYSPPPKTSGDDGRDWLVPLLAGSLVAVALAVGVGARRLKRRTP